MSARVLLAVRQQRLEAAAGALLSEGRLGPEEGCERAGGLRSAGFSLAAEQLAEVLEGLAHLALDVALGEPALLDPAHQRPRFPDDLNGDRGLLPRLIQPEENFGAGALAVLDPSKGASRVHVHDLELGDAFPKMGREPGASLERTVGLHGGASGQPLADAFGIGEDRVDLVPGCRDTIDVGVSDRSHGAPGPWWTRGREGLR